MFPSGSGVFGPQYGPPSELNGLRLTTTTTRLDVEVAYADAIFIRGEQLSRATFGSLNYGTAFEMNSDGTISATPIAASTLYYVYACGRQETDFPGSLALSTTSPASVDGLNYLQDVGAGIGAYARLVGMVFTDTLTHVQDTTSARCLYNYYNQQLKHLLVTPGYVDANANTTVTRNNAAYGPVNAGSGDNVEYILGGDVIQIEAGFMLDTAPGGPMKVGIGLDSTTYPTAVAGFANAAAALTSAYVSAKEAAAAAPSGWKHHTASMLCFTNGVNLVLRSANQFNGGAHAPASLYLAGVLRC